MITSTFAETPLRRDFPRTLEGDRDDPEKIRIETIGGQKATRKEIPEENPRRLGRRRERAGERVADGQAYAQADLVLLLDRHAEMHRRRIGLE